MIGGFDIIIPSVLDYQQLDSLICRFLYLWPDLILEEIFEFEKQEIFIYQDSNIQQDWESGGLGDNILYIIVDTNMTTFVLDREDSILTKYLQCMLEEVFIGINL